MGLREVLVVLHNVIHAKRENERKQRARSAKASTKLAEEIDSSDASGSHSKAVILTSKAVLKERMEPYVFIIHTGTNNPALEKTNKWEDGQMNFIINPHSNRASELIHVKELFPANREDFVTVSRHLPSSIGKPLQLRINVESNKLEIIKDALYIREITIRYKYKLYRFPVNDYLYPHNPLLGPSPDVKYGCPPYVISRHGKGTLLHEETDPECIAARVEELSLKRKNIQWADNKSEYALPTWIKETDYEKLPRFLKFKNARQKAFQMNLKRGANIVKWAVIENKIATYFGKNEPEHFLDFKEIMKFFLYQSEAHDYDRGMVNYVLDVMKSWKTDEEFVRQELNGINPSRIRKCESLPEYWSGMPDMPEHVMPGTNLEAEIGAGKVYIIDTQMLAGIGDGGMLMPLLTGFNLPMVVTLSDCLFYLDPSDKLRPVAIRIEYRNGDQPPSYWYPPAADAHEFTHPYLSWLLAKMYFKSSNMQVHAIVTHFVKAHAIPETFAIALHRCLPRQHPLHKLLLPHLSGVIPINVQGREFLTKPQGVMAALMSAGDRLWKLADTYLKEFRYEQLNFAKEFERKKISEIPGYHFADDAMEWWRTLEKFCEEFVSIHYRDDGTVKNDSELQNMVDEIHSIAFRKLPDNAGFPPKVSSVVELVEYCTTLIFSSSIWHTAVNFGQFYYLAFVPNSPCAMTRAPPAQTDEVTYDDIMLSLPVKEMARVQIDISYSLSLFSPVEKYYLSSAAEGKLDILTETTMVDDEELECLERLQARLKVLKKKIETRNATLDIPYDILLPSNTSLTVQT